MSNRSVLLDRVQIDNDGSVVTLSESSGGLNLGDFFRNGGGSKLVIHLQTTNKVASFAVKDTLKASGPNHASFTVPQKFRAQVRQVGRTEPLFILALTRRSFNVSPVMWVTASPTSVMADGEVWLTAFAADPEDYESELDVPMDCTPACWHI